jgi:hypothetical protein
MGELYTFAIMLFAITLMPTISEANTKKDGTAKTEKKAKHPNYLKGFDPNRPLSKMDAEPFVPFYLIRQQKMREEQQKMNEQLGIKPKNLPPR